MKFEFREIEPWPGVGPEWSDWRWQLRNSLKSKSEFASLFELTADESAGFDGKDSLFQIRSTPYYAALADRTQPADPIRRMMIPQRKELRRDGQQMPDPLGEKAHSPLERLVHRYPDRVLFLVTDFCSVYCRFCLRKHFTGQEQAFIGSRDYEAALDYFRRGKGIREVILSGGDPLTLSDEKLERLLGDLRQIEHIEIIRIGSRMPVVCPMRMTPDLVKILRRHAPVFLMTHFNHPAELTRPAAEALERTVDTGVPVFNQMVLLRGINNHAAVVQALSRRLLYLRVKPYYMFQCDPSEGTDHFRTAVDESLAIQRELWGRLSGLAMPNLSLDIPGGGGKVGLVPEFEKEVVSGARIYKGWDGFIGEYRDPEVASELPCDLENYISEWELLKSQPYGK